MLLMEVSSMMVLGPLRVNFVCFNPVFANGAHSYLPSGTLGLVTHDYFIFFQSPCSILKRVMQFHKAKKPPTTKTQLKKNYDIAKPNAESQDVQETPDI